MSELKGRVRCNKCGAKILKTGVCPGCGNARCHIDIFWHNKRYRYYQDTNGDNFSGISATKQLLAMNREIEAKIFKPDTWEPGAIQGRKIKYAIQEWLKDIREKASLGQLSFGTYYTYLSRANKHILHPEYGLGEWDIRDITAIELKIFAKALSRNIKGISTQRSVMRDLHAFFHWSVTEPFLIEHIPQFPSIEGDNSRKKKALSIEDQPIVLARIPARHRDIYEFSAAQGPRPGESCALKIGDIDFTKKTIHLRSTFIARGILREKDKEGHQKVMPLTEKAFEIVKRHAAGRFPADWLFINPDNQKHYTVKALDSIWKKYSGVSITHYEGTRHSYGTQIYQKTGDIKITQEALRHADIKSTMKYVHVDTEYLRSVLEQRTTNVVDIQKKKEQ